jgi:IS30 family transposase
MMSDQTTTDREDSNSGSDDSSYHTDPNQPASENDEHNQVETIASKDVLRNIVERLLSEGHKGPSIIKILLSQHNISISASTLTRKRKTWGLRQLERQQPVQVQLSPHIRASLLSSHSKGLNLQEIQARLAKETGIVVCLRTVKQYLSRLRVKLNVNDLAEGKVTLEQLYEAVHHIRNYLLHNNTGYRQMKTLLARNYNIHIPR